MRQDGSQPAAYAAVHTTRCGLELEILSQLHEYPAVVIRQEVFDVADAVLYPLRPRVSIKIAQLLLGVLVFEALPRIELFRVISYIH
jgi:hypothetical protein